MCWPTDDTPHFLSSSRCKNKKSAVFVQLDAPSPALILPATCHVSLVAFMVFSP